MKIALDLALKGQGFTSPNPVVGAVVVREGRIVGKAGMRLRERLTPKSMPLRMRERLQLGRRCMSPSNPAIIQAAPRPVRKKSLPPGLSG